MALRIAIGNATTQTSPSQGLTHRFSDYTRESLVIHTQVAAKKGGGSLSYYKHIVQQTRQYFMRSSRVLEHYQIGSISLISDFIKHICDYSPSNTRLLFQLLKWTSRKKTVDTLWAAKSFVFVYALGYRRVIRLPRQYSLSLPPQTSSGK